MISDTKTDTSEILDGIRSWVEIESQTADTDGVNRMMSKVAADYADAGATVTRIAGRDGYGDHLSLRSPWDGTGVGTGGGEQPGILILCHVDTVHPRGTLSAHLPFRVDGDRVYGPGIYDMKGGAHLAFAAFRELTRTGQTTPLPIEFLYTSDEEVGSPTSRVLIEEAAKRAKFVLVTEPARDGGKIVVARKGVARYVLTAHGRPAHSGARHEEGRSAILELARQIVDLEAMTDYARGTTVNVGQIGGGTADNVVPQLAWANIDMRVATIADADAMHLKMTSLKAYNADVTLEVSGGLNRPPYEQNDGVTKLFAHARALARDLDIDLVGVTTGGGSDGNFTAHMVATLDGLGVDGDGAHTLREHMLASSLIPRMSLMKRLFETLQ